MTTIIDTTITCPYCGCDFDTYVYGSYHNFGFNDLDGKVNDTSAPQYYMASFAHFCPECGICFFEGEEVMDDEMKKYMKSEEYTECKGHALKGRAAEVFRYGLRRLKEMHDIEASKVAETEEDMNLKYQKKGKAITAFKDVAWMSSTERAKPLRREIVQLLSDDYIDSLPHGERTTVDRIKADIMRQAGMFDEVIKQYDDVHYDNEHEEKCLRFIVEKAKQGDNSPYSTEAVFWKQDPKDYYGTYWAYYHADDDVYSSLIKIDENGNTFDYSYREDKWESRDWWGADNNINETIRRLKVTGDQEIAKEDVEDVKKSVYKYWYNWNHRIGHYWQHWGYEPILINEMPNTYWAGHTEDNEYDYYSLIRFDENCSAEYYDAINDEWCNIETINNADDLETAIMNDEDDVIKGSFSYKTRIDEEMLDEVMECIKEYQEEKG